MARDPPSGIRPGKNRRPAMDACDFEAEFLAKPWWSPELFGSLRCRRMHRIRHGRSAPWPERFEATGLRLGPVVHWLAVLPGWRRRGIGRLLLSQLHQCCWDAGYRQVWLETHSRAGPPCSLYRECGYREVRAD